MAVSSISCSLKPPTPIKEACSARLQPSPPATTTTPWSGGLRRVCVAAAACVVIGTAGGGDTALARGGDVAASTPHDVVVAAVDARAPPRWSDRRECPPWSANSLENIVPENLPRPSGRRSFNSIKAPERAPALAPEVGARFLALHSGLGCFSL